MITRNGTILPWRICSKIKRAVAERSGATVKTERVEIGAHPPGLSGFQAAAVQFVRRFASSPATCCIAFLLVRRAA